MENIEQRVKKIVAEQLGVNEADIKNESSFVDDLGADSLDTVELVMALEEEFGTNKPRRSRPFNRRSISFSPTRSNSTSGFSKAGRQNIDSPARLSRIDPIQFFLTVSGVQFGTSSSCHHRPGDRLSGRQ